MSELGVWRGLTGAGHLDLLQTFQFVMLMFQIYMSDWIQIHFPAVKVFCMRLLIKKTVPIDTGYRIDLDV